MTTDQHDMLTNRLGWVPYAGLGVLLFLMAWVPNTFESVVRNDPSRKIEIPEQLLWPMNVKAAFNDSTMYFQFELPTPEPSWYHDYWVYEGDGKWRREGASTVGRQPNRIYEDRISFFLDDGHVPEFGKWGGFVTVSGRGMRFFTDAAAEDVQQHPYYGPKGKKDLRKWLPQTRTDPHDWTTVRPEEELEALRAAGYFLDLWHWRAHRSNPIGWSDDQYVLDYRWSDAGAGPYATNWDDVRKQPKYMFDPEIAGARAMRWDEVLQQGYAQDDYLRYALVLGNENLQGNTVPFDPQHTWNIGDVIPRRLLRAPEGSHGSIHANGIYRDGKWTVDLWRALDTDSSGDDKVLHDKGVYQIAFAAHILSTGSRWHYVSFPMTLGLDRHADIVATKFRGEVPPWQGIEWTELTLFYPGQMDWQHVTSDAHAGAPHISAGTPLSIGHDEATLAKYAVEFEFREPIFDQWIQTLVSLAALLLLLTATVWFAAPGRRSTPSHHTRTDA